MAAQQCVAAGAPAAAVTAAGWLPAARFASGLEPYRRVGAVLLREDCASVAVSNPYLTLAAGAGGVMLRGGRVPERALRLLVAKAAPPGELSGWVIGCERGTPSPALLSPGRAETLRGLLAALALAAPPGLPLCWHARPPGEGASCRIAPPLAAGAAGECNAGGEFLQSFLDGLGELNTFG